MGESLLEIPKVDYKMGESITNVPCLEQSVSFGRFERDSLCWERWSTFPTNKYLEEVEKCSTPGSVAQKKAYFEAHYKQIAARRAELQREAELARFEELDNDQRENEVGGFEGEERVEHDHMKSNIADMPYQENEVDSFDGDLSVEHAHVKSDSSDGFYQENDVLDLPGEISGHDHGPPIVNEVSELSNITIEKCEDVDEFKGRDDAIDESSEALKIEIKDICEANDAGADVTDEEVVKSEVTEHFDNPVDGRPQEELSDSRLTSKIPKLGNLKTRASMIKDVPSPLGSKMEELPEEKVKRTIVEEKTGNLMKSVIAKKAQKATLVKKTASTTNINKRPTTPVPKSTTAPMPKSPMLSTPKSSKTELIKVAKSASRLLDKKENVLTRPTIKKTVEPQIKRIAPTSLHMSLSLGPMNRDPASTMRKSLIMESMRDKDIVKRAFKAFQNAPQTPPPSLIKSPAPSQSASRKAGQKVSPTNTLPNKNEGSGKAAKTAGTRTGEQGARKTLSSPGVKKNFGADQRNVKFVAASFGPRVQLQGNNQKEVSKKLDLKVQTNVSETTLLQSKLKVEKAAQVKKSTQSVISKPKFPSSYNHRHGGSVHKEDGKAKASG